MSKAMFLGIQAIDFTDKKTGNEIKGAKLHICHDSSKRGFRGIESEQIFLDSVRDKLVIDMAAACEPMKFYDFVLEQSFSGKSRIVCINPIKE